MMEENGFEIFIIEMYIGGELFRIIVFGYFEIKGDIILVKRWYVWEYFDYFCKLVMFEFCGYYDMYGVVIV